ncbi:type II toxin-antitoxin system PemK/MazF family toxin [Mannheimia indoligenes]|uniref:type II toxin-antitoxin system PemK/MazF family toxin n=1 Tax=Mannheimia indoligenes TaxID=3103145 RepID=UPI002FE600E5
MDMVRGDIYLVNLDPTVGSEIQKTRPCVIISPPEIHDYLRSALIAPMTTGSRPAPFRIPIDFQGKSGLILPEQIHAVDKTRLVKKVGELENEKLAQLLAVLQEMFAE